MLVVVDRLGLFLFRQSSSVNRSARRQPPVRRSARNFSRATATARLDGRRGIDKISSDTPPRRDIAGARALRRYISIVHPRTSAVATAPILVPRRDLYARDRAPRKVARLSAIAPIVWHFGPRGTRGKWQLDSRGETCVWKREDRSLEKRQGRRTVLQPSPNRARAADFSQYHGRDAVSQPPCANTPYTIARNVSGCTGLLASVPRRSVSERNCPMKYVKSANFSKNLLIIFQSRIIHFYRENASL